MNRQMKFGSLHVHNGFTLIELLIVFAIMGLLLVVGMGAYGNYNKTQGLQVGSADVLNMLSTARSRAISQVKPPVCGAAALRSYRVRMFPNTRDYRLEVLCGLNIRILTTKQLPPDVTFTATSTSMVSFSISTGVSPTASSVNITSGGKTKAITVQTSGTIISN